MSDAGIAGASVFVYCISDDVPVGVYYTDTSGNWTCDEAESGLTYIVSYYHRNYTFAENDYTCIASGSGTVLDTVTATLRIAEPAANPASDFTYSVINGLYISITGYTGNATNVVIPEKIGSYTVQSIGSAVFRNNPTIQSIYLPNTLESIGTNAFYGCTNLTNIYLNSGLKSIGEAAFRGCTGLTSIGLPNTLTTINGYVKFFLAIENYSN